MTLDWNARYQPRRDPERTLRHMTPNDVPAAVRLTHAVGWHHDERDFLRLLHWSPEGCFCVEEADHGVIGTVTTTVYGTALAWIGMLIVPPDRQRQGIGGQLMRAALDYLIARGTERIMLDSTDAGRPLYERMGFRKVYKVERWEGRASTYLGPRARRMREHDLEAVRALDARLFGADRGHILQRLWDEFPELAWIDEVDGKIDAFMFGRQTPQAVYIGPWMSWTTTAAERVLRVAFEQLQGAHVTMNIPDQNGRSLLLARNHNLKRIRHCTRMIFGDARPIEGEPLTQMAVTSLATG